MQPGCTATWLQSLAFGNQASAWLRSSAPQVRGSDRNLRERRLLLQDFAALLVRDDLALHALQRVVDRLRVAAEPLGHVFVGRALEVEAERVGLERREAGAAAEDEALQLLRRDHDHRRLVDAGARQGVAERALAVRVLAGRRVAERDVRVEGRVLEPGRGLDRGDDLPGDAELREAPERGLLVGPEV